MKPVVSSLVALAIAIAPISEFAATKGHKPVVAKIEKHHSKKDQKVAEKDKSDKTDAKESAVVRVKHGKKGEAKPVVHHAHNVDLSGAGHKEPKVDHGVSVVPASLKTAHAKPNAKSNDLPKLPPSAAKPVKSGSEKGAKKATEKKHDDSAKDGEPKRDEEFAELVARIRGRHTGNEKLAENGSNDSEPTDPDKKAKHGNVEKRPACNKEPVEVIRGPEFERFELMRCDGSIAPYAVEHLSILIRPGGAARPTTSVYELAKKKGPDLAPGIKRVDPRLIERLQAVVDKFGKNGSERVPVKLSVISGYRPTSTGSMHATGRAIDFRIEGVKNDDVVSFCKTLGDTGCGFYPNSSFVHLDVRDAGAGHVSWIDASGPGETPRYVSQWPPPPLAAGKKAHQDPPSGPLEHTSAKQPTEELDREKAPEPSDDHPAETSTESR